MKNAILLTCVVALLPSCTQMQFRKDKSQVSTLDLCRVSANHEKYTDKQFIADVLNEISTRGYSMMYCEAELSRADEENSRNMAIILGAVAAGAAVGYAARHSGGVAAATDYDWDWDQFATQDGLTWRCRGVQTGQYSDNWRCNGKAMTDWRWPEK